MASPDGAVPRLIHRSRTELPEKWPGEVPESYLAHVALSEDEQYRYSLYHCWDEGKPRVTFLMLNPSTATEEVMDQTLRRCIRYAMDWNMGSLLVLNLFNYRATKPDDLKQVEDPFGPGANEFLIHALPYVGYLVAAWGNHGQLHDRADQVLALLKAHAVPIFHLVQTASGQPAHPLRLASDLTPQPYVPAES